MSARLLAGLLHDADGALLVEWRHTAEIYADPLLYTAATRVLGDDGGPVLRPNTPDTVA